VDMRPGASGIDIIVRYVTRASDRFEVRNHLYQCVIDLLHQPLTPRTQPDQAQSLLSGGPQNRVVRKPLSYSTADAELTRTP
jgi:hypothetical protein